MTRERKSDKAKLIFLELNEVNFDIIRKYLRSGVVLPNFKSLLDYQARATTSEDSYELLEPWIQWPSVHTGKPYSEHQIYRLGDSVKVSPVQIFEKVEAAGYSVGAISPMNTINKLKAPSYFIPDPWTQTESDKSVFSRQLTKALRQTVNDNSSSKVSFTSLFVLFYALLAHVRVVEYLKFIRLALTSFKKPWRKALFLDLLLHEIHLKKIRNNRPDFSTIFLNAGAHIQHHYFLNCSQISERYASNPSWYVSEEEDPLEEMLHVYDSILGDLLGFTGYEMLVATGLSQVPVSETVFYYRLADHEQFLKEIGVKFESVVPRMTRDFLIKFDSPQSAVIAEAKLASLTTGDNKRIFGEIENRGKELFVVLDFSGEIISTTQIEVDGERHLLLPSVVFVALKNGQHTGKGFAFFSDGIAWCAPDNDKHVSSIFDSISKFFDLGRISVS
jgi:hypothetical protein